MNKAIRTHLIDARKRKGWSQQEVADHLGTTQHNVSRWESGVTRPSLYFRTKLCVLFGKSAQELGIGPQDTLSPERNRIEADAPVSTSLWNVPYPRNPFFTGREDLLHTLHEQLHRECRLALSQSWAISGLGGIGKTQIALEYAYQYRQDYRAIFWINAASRETLLTGCVSIADLLQLPGKDEPDQNKIFVAVKRWLATHQDWLLILDNADDVTVVQNMELPERAGHLLLTTRAQALGSLAQRLDIETMGMAESTLFLLRRSKLLAPDTSLDQASEEQLASAETIAIEMDFLPLALDQAGAYIEEVGCSLASYLELYRAHRADLLRRRGRVVSDHPEPVATTWSLNFRQVEQASPAAADLLRLCAFLAPDAIPEELFREGSAFLPAALQQASIDELALNDAIEELRIFSLVQRNPDSKLLRVHRLMQAVLKDAMEDGAQRLWAERVVRVVNATFPRDPKEAATWSRCLRYLEQAQASEMLVRQHQLVLPEAADLLDRTGLYLFARGLYTPVESLYQLALQIRSQYLELQQASSLYNLGFFYRTQGKYAEAEPLYQQALRIREQQLGPAHPEVADVLNGLAILYYYQGKHTEVEPLYQRALRIREQQWGPTHPEVAQVLNNLAMLYKEQGKYTEAEALYQRALAIREHQWGPEHPEVAHTLIGLAMLYKEQGKYAEAEALYQRALHMCERLLGSEHPDLAEVLYDFAAFHATQGNVQEAALLYQRTLAIREQVLGLEHPKTMATRTTYTALLQRMADNQQSAEPDFFLQKSQPEQMGKTE